MAEWARVIRCGRARRTGAAGVVKRHHGSPYGKGKTQGANPKSQTFDAFGSPPARPRAGVPATEPSPAGAG